jgi:prepilin-type N-terminal cleavage/methylation domain-containing protein
MTRMDFAAASCTRMAINHTRDRADRSNVTIRPGMRGVGVRASDSDAGVTLVECMVAIVLFGLVGIAAASMLVTGIKVSARTRDQSQAASLASNSVEAFRDNASLACAWQNPLPVGCGATSSVVPPAVTTSAQSVGSQPFTIKQTTEYEAKATSQTACNASAQGGSAGVQPVLLLTESVTWPTIGTALPVTSQTILAPPVGAFSNNTGAIDIGVVNSLNHADAGIPVTVNGASGTTTYTTDSNGCALAAFLTPGSYTVSIASSGYIDNQESSTSTQTLGVTTGNVTTASFFYDQAATLGATFVKTSSWPLGVTFQSAVNLPITVANSGLAGTGTYLLPNGTAGSSVYPYSSGYTIWAGRCPEANPDAVTSSTSPLYPVGVTNNAPAPTTVATPAGQTATASVPLYPLTINFTDAASKPVTFTITEAAGAAKTPCTAPFSTYTLPVSVAGSPVTKTYVAGVPLGVFTLKATDGTSSQTVSPNVNVGLTGATATVAL